MGGVLTGPLAARAGWVAVAVFGLLATSCSDESAPTAVAAAGGTVGAGGSGGGGGLAGSGGVPDAGAELDCLPGQLLLEDLTCRAPGVPAAACGVGFEPVAEGACAAVLPADPCESGRMALPGETSCREVAPCALGPWGDIPVEAHTQYVDGAYAGGGSNGTAGQPWVSIQQGVDAAVGGAIVAIAAGTYAENVTVNKSVRLWGKCPDAVAIVGSGSGLPLRFVGGAVAAEARDLAVGPAADGIRVEDATGVLLDRVWVHDVGGFGIMAIDITSAPSMSLQRSLVEAATTSSVVGWGASSVTIEDTVVRGTGPGQTDDGGDGLFAFGTSNAPRPAIALRRSVLRDHRSHGIVVGAVDLLVEDSFVTDILPRLSDQKGGYGVYAKWQSDTGERPLVTLRRSVVQRSHTFGVQVRDGDLQMEHSVVRAVEPTQADGSNGVGVQLAGFAQSAQLLPQGEIRQSLIEDTHYMGLSVNGADAEIESLIVRNTQPHPLDDWGGEGISASENPTSGWAASVAIRGCRVEGSHEAGILLEGSHGEIESTAVLDTQPNVATGSFGVGVGFLPSMPSFEPSTGSLSQVVVEEAHTAGIIVLASVATAADVVVQSTKPSPAIADFGDGIVLSSSLVFIPGLYPTSLEITRATVEESARAGIANFAAALSVGDSLLDCNSIDLDGETIEDRAPQFADLGGNVCRCGGEVYGCQVLSSQLTPPTPPGM